MENTRNISLVIVVISLFSIILAYQDIDDKFDYDSTFRNRTQLHDFIACFLDKGPCTDVMEHVKEHVKQIVQNGCRDCDDIQRHAGHLFHSAMKKYFPDEYKAYRAKYDSDQKHLTMLENAVDKYK